ncbi:hypothetical protein PTKIN_Ptkin15bG0104400 [Pterospermum kingtungense]
MDQYTAKRTRLKYARVCIELDLNKKIPKFIDAIRRNGQVASVKVVVPSLPARCKECLNLGHIAKACLNKPIKPINKVWKPK